MIYSYICVIVLSIVLKVCSDIYNGRQILTLFDTFISNWEVWNMNYVMKSKLWHLGPIVELNEL